MRVEAVGSEVPGCIFYLDSKFPTMLQKRNKRQSQYESVKRIFGM